jgi:hypothetical protein
MPLNTIPLPYGLREVKITPYTDATRTTLAGSSIKFPNMQTLSFKETEDFQELRGDDQLVAVHGSGPNIEWELEGGGYSFEAVAAMYGGTVTTTGVTPNQVKTYDKLGTDIRPYFKARGRAISDSGGDFHCLIHAARATDDLEGELKDGEFWLTKASGTGLPSLVVADIGKVYSFIQNETATAVP